MRVIGADRRQARRRPATLVRKGVACLWLCCAASVFPRQLAARQDSTGFTRGLNGYLLGQRKSAIEAGFQVVLQSDTMPDGWTVAAYALDPEHRAYMAFQFPPNVDRAYSVQVAGNPGTPMTPFRGLRLGASRAEIVDRLGSPTSVDHLDEYGVDVLKYENANYSLEVNESDELSSILIFQPPLPDSVTPADSLSLDVFEEAMLTRDPARIVDVVSGDMDIGNAAKIYSIQGSAVNAIADSTGALARLLWAGEESLAAVLQNETVRRQARLDVRVYENRPSNFVFKFDDETPLTEVVVEFDNGAWRIWEVRFR